MSYEEIKIETKICSQCDIEKNISEFRLVSLKYPNKFRAACKKCIKLKNKVYDNKEEICENKKKYRDDNRDLINENARKSYHENFEKRSESASKSYLKNKDKILKRREVFAQENPGKVKKRNKRSSDKRRKKAENRIHESISSMVSNTIRNSGKSKNNLSISKYLLYSFFELKIHLESQFEPWMNWDNYGRASKNKQTWQIDHIIPRINFKYESMDSYNFQKCWALENLRPLSAVENLSKKDKISNELYNETMDKINLELKTHAENNKEFNIKLEQWKLEEELNKKQLNDIGLK